METYLLLEAIPVVLLVAGFAAVAIFRKHLFHGPHG